MVVRSLLALVSRSVVKPGSALSERLMNVFRIRRIGAGLAALFLMLVLATLAALDHRHHRMTELYNTALRGGTAEADTALVQLARFHGEEATELLLRFASPSTNRLPDNRLDLTVQLLKQRKDPQVAARLAEFLKPNSPRALRTDVSDALLEMECNLACARSVLHYLERMSWGELNIEEAFD